MRWTWLLELEPKGSLPLCRGHRPPQARNRQGCESAGLAGIDQELGIVPGWSCEFSKNLNHLSKYVVTFMETSHQRLRHSRHFHLYKGGSNLGAFGYQDLRPFKVLI